MLGTVLDSSAHLTENQRRVRRDIGKPTITGPSDHGCNCFMHKMQWLWKCVHP